ncbi:single-stranded DNA-binding protein [Salinispirillum sp. LH 10-3-1]|uniref:Single-stranded DNA-binding protein n=1 Tax=Salinispirillum sp. LH 10-3-1 TaxID=2952525 RepID=A0AB38YJS9_9GAMM
MAKGTVNKVIILGRLGQDPDVKATASGTQVVNLNVATNELGMKDQSTGQRGPDQTEWHRCTLFGRQAEIAAQYLSKGSLVYLEGRLQTRKWQDQSGNDRWSTEIICNEMQLMGGGGQGGQGSQGQQYGGGQAQPAGNNYQQPNNNPFNQPNQPAPRQQAPQQQAPQQAAQQSTGSFDDFDDDIPF